MMFKVDFFFLICTFISTTAFSQKIDTVWSGDYDRVNNKERCMDVRNPCIQIDSLKKTDSSYVKIFTIYGDSLLPKYLLSFKNLKTLKIKKISALNNINILSQLPKLEELFITNSNIRAIPKGMVNLNLLWIDNDWQVNSI